MKSLTFQSGYDFGYMLKLLTEENLPSEEFSHFEVFRIYFPHIYNGKYLIKSCKHLEG